MSTSILVSAIDLLHALRREGLPDKITIRCDEAVLDAIYREAGGKGLCPENELVLMGCLTIIGEKRT